MKPLALACALLALALVACSDAHDYSQAVAVLIDVSGTYADQTPEVARIVKREILPELVPGDTVAIVRIDSESYKKSNVEALVTLDNRPSHANAQKLELAKRLDAFAARGERSQYTDIPGAMMLAAEYLRETGAKSRAIVLFSDMQSDLPPGAKRHFDEHEFEGIRIVALNVKQLARDNQDPDVLRSRLASWEHEVTHAGAGGFTTFLDPAKLGPFLAEIR
ncbi:MAG TPA: VWA domain-containing protein [Myxococcota bacterium]|nr:VWA domain-containing protein [Myxococcota bacterium]